jgi:D-methionine transport system ATP-binding protein
MISLTSVSKLFGDPHSNNRVLAVNDVSLEIKDGEIFGIIGQSGAGKSTLVRLINLLERPTTGTVSVGGVNLTTLKPAQLRARRREIGMIFQHFNLMATRTALGNVLFALKDTQLSNVERRAKALNLLELVGIAHRANNYPAELSGGEKQRVAIARALANDPKVLLCDEATSALDPSTTESVLSLLKKLNRELGLTIVVITHEMDVIKEVADRVAVMEHGEVKEVGDVFEVFSAPQSEVARKFVATTNPLFRVHELVAQKSPLVEIGGQEKLVKLSYIVADARESILADAANANGTTTSVRFGGIELIKGRQFGNLITSIKGEPDAVASTIKYLEQNHVNVEVIV